MIVKTGHQNDIKTTYSAVWFNGNKEGKAIKLEKLFSLHVFVCVLVEGKEMRESKWREN